MVRRRGLGNGRTMRRSVTTTLALMLMLIFIVVPTTSAQTPNQQPSAGTGPKLRQAYLGDQRVMQRWTLHTKGGEPEVCAKKKASFAEMKTACEPATFDPSKQRVIVFQSGPSQNVTTSQLKCKYGNLFVDFFKPPVDGYFDHTEFILREYFFVHSKLSYGCANARILATSDTACHDAPGQDSIEIASMSTAIKEDKVESVRHRKFVPASRTSLAVDVSNCKGVADLMPLSALARFAKGLESIPVAAPGAADGDASNAQATLKAGALGLLLPLYAISLIL